MKYLIDFIGGGKLFVTVVNVFGSWTGNFLPPGFQKPAAQAANDPGVGGADVGPSSGQSSNTQTSNSSNSQGSGSTTTASAPPTTGTTQLTIAGGTLGSVRVLGTTTTEEDSASATQGRRVVQVNLAWLILLLPCAILLLGRKKIGRLLRKNSPAN